MKKMIIVRIIMIMMMIVPSYNFTELFTAPEVCTDSCC